MKLKFHTKQEKQEKLLLIKSMLSQGKNQKQIAKEVGLSQGTVSAWLLAEKRDSGKVVVHAPKATTHSEAAKKAWVTKKAKQQQTKTPQRILCLWATPEEIIEVMGRLS